MANHFDMIDKLVEGAMQCKIAENKLVSGALNCCVVHLSSSRCHFMGMCTCGIGQALWSEHNQFELMLTWFAPFLPEYV